MTSNSEKQDIEKLHTDEAWTKLQSRLESEPVNHTWAVWGGNDPSSDPGSADISDIVSGSTEPEQFTQGQEPEVTGKKTARRSRRHRMTRRRKWASVAAAVAIFGAILATPVGNTAVAAILNQFRMQEVTVVNEGDLRNMFYQISENGNVHETVNKFGAFTSSSGPISGDLPLEKLADTLGYTPLAGAVMKTTTTVSINPSREITLNLNVEAVNTAMKRLGAEDLLPESVDGKPITLQLPEIVSYDLSTGKEDWAALTQMNTPVITVDPSIKVEEALSAIINFPLLPDYLKSSLQESRILSGEIPMPLIKGNNSEQITVEGTPVILDQYENNRGPLYNATWVQNGQMFRLEGGEVYSGKQQMIEKLQELISP